MRLKKLRSLAAAIGKLPGVDSANDLYFQHSSAGRCIISLGNVFDSETRKFTANYGENDERKFAETYGISVRDAEALNFGNFHRLDIDEPESFMDTKPKTAARVLRKLAAKYEAV